MKSPFHAGELSIQDHVGVRNAALRLARLIAERIPPGAMTFVTQQHFCVLGQIDHKGDIWAHIITGDDGLARASKDGSTLYIQGVSSLHTPRPGDPVGVLFIDLESRMRLRVNGTLAACHATSLKIRVKEVFPNCPKYIQQRQSIAIAHAKPQAKTKTGDTLTPAHEDWIKNADTFFVASALRAGPADVSHRGGKPGFVQVNDGVLSIPDYPGNSMFGTLGNFAQNPQAGLVFVDFAHGQQLLLTGKVQLDLDAGDRNGNTGGTGRWWHFAPQQWITHPLHPAMTWALTEPSPFNP
jgi:uncharacterized protein